MKHFTEHEIELYVLAAPEAVKKRKEITAHSKKCAGCRDLAAEISAYYDSAEKEVRMQPSSGMDTRRVLMRRRADLPRFNEPYAEPIVRAPETRLERFRSFARQHPVVIGGTTFAGLGIAAFALNLLFRAPSEDLNPAYHFLNAGTGMLEVYNKSDQKLWQKPVVQASDLANQEHDLETRLTIVTDLFKNGKNEVLTVLPVTSVSGASQFATTLRVFDSEKGTRWAKEVGERSKYIGVTYGPDFGCTGMSVIDGEKPGEREIVVIASNWRSPSVLTRFDARGNVLGEYWHFGHVKFGFAVDLYGDGRRQILLGGKNDVRDSVGGDFAAVIILDPLKIKGKTESTVTPGFGLPASAAEMFYVRLPDPDINVALKTSGNVYRIKLEDPNFIRVFYGTGYQGMPGHEGGPSFEYFFSKQMKATSVKPVSGAEVIYAKMREEGKITSQLNSRYLENLRQSVKYWDGKEWGTEPLGPKIQNAN